MYKPVSKTRTNPFPSSETTPLKKKKALHIQDKSEEPKATPEFYWQTDKGFPTLCGLWRPVDELSTPNEIMYSKGVCRSCMAIKGQLA